MLQWCRPRRKRLLSKLYAVLRKSPKSRTAGLGIIIVQPYVFFLFFFNTRYDLAHRMHATAAHACGPPLPTIRHAIYVRPL